MIVGYFLFYGRVAGVFCHRHHGAVPRHASDFVAVDITGGLNGLREFPPLQFRIPGLFVLTMTGDWAPYYSTVIIWVCYSWRPSRSCGPPSAGAWSHQG